jgi:hypothetical protein
MCAEVKNGSVGLEFEGILVLICIRPWSTPPKPSQTSVEKSASRKSRSAATCKVSTLKSISLMCAELMAGDFNLRA